MQVSAAHNRLQDVRLGGRAVSVATESGQRAQYVISRLPQGDYVYARMGRVSLREEMLGVTTAVPEGRVAILGPEPGSGASTPPQAGSDHAGRVGAAVPKGYLMRASQRMSSNAGDDVRWNDEMVTESTGRTRVSLDDGSILSLGSNSHLKVVQHDAGTQQTQLELGVGKVRAQVIKLAKPNASFTVKTPTAVAGVVGTDFYIEFDGKKTRVTVLEGIVKLTPVVAAAITSAALASQTATVTAGQTTTVAGGAITSPVAATPSQLQAAQTATSTSAVAAGTTAVSTVVIATAAGVPAVVTTAVVPQIEPSAGNSPAAP